MRLLRLQHEILAAKRACKLGLVYTVRVALASNSINRGDARVSLTPGMAATADMKTGRRSILSYLMSPIDKARLEAGRER